MPDERIHREEEDRNCYTVDEFIDGLSRRGPDHNTDVSKSREQARTKYLKNYFGNAALIDASGHPMRLVDRVTPTGGWRRVWLNWVMGTAPSSHLVGFVLLVSVVFAILSSTLGNLRVDGNNMEHILSDGQGLVVNKLAYSRLDISLLAKLVPFWDVDQFGRAFLFHPPRRGEVIVFRSPTQPDIKLVKRIVGLPGMSQSSGTIRCSWMGYFGMNPMPLVRSLMVSYETVDIDIL